ncbi:MAG: DUF3883 domain-containing protein [Candidatus Nanopelagicaceae bacterium]|nr:DUF3883 domain-containing protein [Candidatus Nanopelagicaceae bacterium]
MDEVLQGRRAAAIWNVLVAQANLGKPITYKELSKKVDVHHRALRFGLGIIKTYCRESGLPHLTALVINSSTGIPGEGADLSPSELENEYKLIFAHDWKSRANPFDAQKRDGTHSWWEESFGEKYWVESTDRKDLGKNLLAPKSANAGQKLVSFVEDGDIILHYYQPTKSIIAFSIAKGFPKTSQIRWPDREHSKLQPAYTIDLMNYTELDEPVTLKELQGKEKEIRAIKSSLDEKYLGKAIYFPFQIPDKKVIQPAQGAYLTKMPKALFLMFPRIEKQIENDVAPEIIQVKPVKRSGLASYVANKPSGPSGDSFGRPADEIKKKAIEERGMKLTTEYLTNLGYAVEDVSRQKKLGYDLRATKADEIVGVEVKGSMLSRISIDVTLAEVEFAQNSGHGYRTLLFVVDGITCTKDGGDYVASGGRERHWWDWNPDDLALMPIEYRYTLPL